MSIQVQHLVFDDEISNRLARADHERLLTEARVARGRAEQPIRTSLRVRAGAVLIAMGTRLCGSHGLNQAGGAAAVPAP
jgi:hypothetical protein